MSTEQEDPRIAVLKNSSQFDSAGEILANLDAADAAAGIRRVTADAVRCPACELYYDAEGVRCFRQSATDWVCLEFGTSGGGES